MGGSGRTIDNKLTGVMDVLPRVGLDVGIAVFAEFAILGT